MIERLGDTKLFCKYCLEPGHTALHCYKKAKDKQLMYGNAKVSSSFGGKRKPIKSHPGVAQRKPIKKTGKQYDKWLATKQRWFEQNKAAYYWCHYCGKQMTRGQLTLDHKVPRSRAPELRHSLKNLVPCCWLCNGLKGSVAHDDYVHECH